MCLTGPGRSQGWLLCMCSDTSGVPPLAVSQGPAATRTAAKAKAAPHHQPNEYQRMDPLRQQQQSTALATLPHPRSLFLFLQSFLPLADPPKHPLTWRRRASAACKPSPMHLETKSAPLACRAHPRASRTRAHTRGSQGWNRRCEGRQGQ